MSLWEDVPAGGFRKKYRPVEIPYKEEKNDTPPESEAERLPELQEYKQPE